MFYFSFSIQNPLPFVEYKGTDGVGYQTDLVEATGKTWLKNKFWEIQISLFSPRDLIDFTLDTRWWGHDHAGLELRIQVLWLFMSFRLYDSRHWNYDENRFYFDGEDQGWGSYEDEEDGKNEQEQQSSGTPD